MNLKEARVAYLRTQFWFDLKAGGSVGHTAGVVNVLNNAAKEVIIITNDELYGVKTTKQEIIRPFISRFCPKAFFEHFYNRKFINKASKIIGEKGLNLIYHRYSITSYEGVALSKKFNIPLILEYNSSEVWKLKNWENRTKGLKAKIKKIVLQPIIYRLAKKNEEYNIHNADLIVVVSFPLRYDLIKRGVDANKIIVNPNGVDISKFCEQPVPVKEMLRKHLNIDDSKIIIGFSGTFGLWHGIPEYTEAIKSINKLFPDNQFIFLMMGDGTLKSKMQKELKEYANVLFTGTILYEDIQKYLDLCDLLISPHGKQVDGKEFFGSPTKLYEYMAMGKGIVASKLGQIGEVLEHNKTGYLVEPGDVEQLREAILYLGQNLEFARELGRNARRIAIENYTWEKNIEKIADGLKSL